MKTLAWWLVTSISLAMGAFGLSACGGDSVDPNDTLTRTPPLRGEWTIEEAQQFDEFALYWLGPEFRGVPLTRVYRFDTRASDPPAEHPENGVHLMYGTCEVSGSFPDPGSCSPPIQINMEGPGQRYCDKYALYPGRTPFRGQAELTRGEIESSGYVWTENVAVKIYANSEAWGPHEVADALVSLNSETALLPGDPLPTISITC